MNNIIKLISEQVRTRDYGCIFRLLRYYS